jgi:hypothetical protein
MGRKNSRKKVHYIKKQVLGVNVPEVLRTVLDILAAGMGI